MKISHNVPAGKRLEKEKGMQLKFVVVVAFFWNLGGSITLYKVVTFVSEWLGFCLGNL